MRTYIHIEPEVIGWIPCSEARPSYEDVVIFTVHRGGRIPFCGVGRRVDSKRMWHDRITGMRFLDCEVTAWAPMPAAYIPPKEEQE